MTYRFLLIFALLFPGPVHATPIDDMLRALLPQQIGSRITSGPSFVQIRRIRVPDDGAGDTGLVDRIDRGMLSRIEVGMRGFAFVVPVSTVLSTQALPSDGSRYDVR